MADPLINRESVESAQIIPVIKKSDIKKIITAIPEEQLDESQRQKIKMFQKNLIT